MIGRLVVALLLLVVCGRASAQLAAWDDRDTIAATQLVRADGKAVRIGDYRGKVVVIDFWGAWCVACRREMPSLRQWQANLADRGERVAFLFVSVDDRRFAADNAWFERSGLVGGNYRWQTRSGAQYHAFFRNSNSRWWAPDALILDADGNIAKWVVGGGTDWSKQADFVRSLIPARTPAG